MSVSYLYKPQRRCLHKRWPSLSTVKLKSCTSSLRWVISTCHREMNVWTSCCRRSCLFNLKICQSYSTGDPLSARNTKITWRNLNSSQFHVFLAPSWSVCPKHSVLNFVAYWIKINVPTGISMNTIKFFKHSYCTILSSQLPPGDHYQITSSVYRHWVEYCAPT